MEVHVLFLSTLFLHFLFSIYSATEFPKKLVGIKLYLFIFLYKSRFSAMYKGSNEPTSDIQAFLHEMFNLKSQSKERHYY